MYDTPLTPTDEINFQNWMNRQRLMQNIYPTDTGQDYDFRGAYKANLAPGLSGHWQDTFKKPNHPTFSNESQYATGLQIPNAGMWVQDIFVPRAQPQQHPLLMQITNLLRQ